MGTCTYYHPLTIVQPLTQGRGAVDVYPYFCLLSAILYPRTLFDTPLGTLQSSHCLVGTEKHPPLPPQVINKARLL
jgi:hypothetical protein